MLTHGVPLREVKVWGCVVSATRITGAILFSQTINSHQKLTHSDTI